MNEREREQLVVWVEKQIDDAIGDQEFSDLERMLSDDAEARQLYLDLMHQHAHLRLGRASLSSPLDISTADVAVGGEPGRTNASRRWVFAIMTLAASGLLLMWWFGGEGQSNPRSQVIATISDTSDAQWGDCSLPTALGSSLTRGRLKIVRGLATVSFASGAKVTLESPAELELQSPMTGHLLAGTAVIDVPESAHGFTLSTPNAVAVDHGTAFSVTVDRDSEISSVEVLDGEVEVQHVVSKKSRRLTDQQRIVASARTLGDPMAASEEARLGDPSFANTPSAANVGEKQVHRITTAEGSGDDATVTLGDESLQQAEGPIDLLLVKNPYAGYEKYHRRAYLAFDLSLIADRSITNARLVLTQRPTGIGFASKVDDCHFIVYGVTNEASDDWGANKLDWSTAPASRKGSVSLDQTQTVELGRFTIRRGVQYGEVRIEGNELIRFLQSDTNRRVTLVIERETREPESGGLVHGFASRFSSRGAPPTLLLETETRQQNDVP